MFQQTRRERKARNRQKRLPSPNLPQVFARVRNRVENHSLRWAPKRKTVRTNNVLVANLISSNDRLCRSKTPFKIEQVLAHHKRGKTETPECPAPIRILPQRKIRLRPDIRPITITNHVCFRICGCHSVENIQHSGQKPIVGIAINNPISRNPLQGIIASATWIVTMPIHKLDICSLATNGGIPLVRNSPSTPRDDNRVFHTRSTRSRTESQRQPSPSKLAAETHNRHLPSITARKFIGKVQKRAYGP